RSKIMEGLPTAGLPMVMRNWSEYTWLINHLMETGFINTIREIWWDIRPHHNFGTVEVRICDMPGTLPEVLAIAALIQCLVVWHSDVTAAGPSRRGGPPMPARKNKWRACRYGLQARLVDYFTYEAAPVPAIVAGLVRRLESTAEAL